MHKQQLQGLLVLLKAPQVVSPMHFLHLPHAQLWLEYRVQCLILLKVVLESYNPQLYNTPVTRFIVQ